jgi:hypothetical protein
VERPVTALTLFFFLSAILIIAMLSAKGGHRNLPYRPGIGRGLVSLKQALIFVILPAMGAGLTVWLKLREL